ncbi:hypothetical protein JG687_00011326 [Phytophthora cactorum]|uniref:Uncharacterized protein n=1 Tax=Phytophthora cactorum TaxID=29920 RepID=A0A8T1U4N3_9STRA|nr:hypothetical protein JG687_00011326 [Phytophthora cactorum]
MEVDSECKYGKDIRSVVEQARRWVSESPLQHFMAYLSIDFAVSRAEPWRMSRI